MTGPVRAADVLAKDVKRRFPHNPDVVCGREGRMIADALLAQSPPGEGVYIAPDGTLARAELIPSAYHFVHYRLVPLEGDD